MSVFELSPADLLAHLRDGKLRAGVVGLGRMGLPIACTLAEAGFSVSGIDVNEELVSMVNLGVGFEDEAGLNDEVKKWVSSGKLRAHTGFEVLKECDVVFIVVPTKAVNRRADYSTLYSACKDIGSYLKRGMLTVLCSTVGPLVTERIVKGVLEERSGLRAEVDFGLAYSPIRATSGRVLRDLRSYPRIVAGLSVRSLEAASTIIGQTTSGGVVKVSSVRVAEVAKLAENVYRDVNIALANEIALICEKLGVDYNEVAHAANTQPFCHLHVPGLGVGGHCIPHNPYFLVDYAISEDLKPSLIVTARNVNDAMPRHTLKLIIDGLNECGKDIRGSHIAILGAAFKPDSADPRYSPVKGLFEDLRMMGAKVKVYDPLVPLKALREQGYSARGSLEEAVRRANCIVVAVPHVALKKELEDKLERVLEAVKAPRLIVDCWRMLDPDAVRRLGFKYRAVGRGL
ncbi:MAG: nucleotide sugar dehydrogenase [Candidatus Nezhaarchaeota archaeon]|nr:nucleotide sugar dehydrogenase [Candidatus Nezhaarchaeota archaeon]